MNSEASSNHQPSQSTFRASILSNPFHYTRHASHDSSTYRSTGKSSCQLNENEVLASTSITTCQSIRVTRMLILVSTCFLILNAPAHLCVIAFKIYTSIDAPVLDEHIKSDHYQQINTMNFLNKNHNRTNNETIIDPLQREHILEDQITIHLFYIAVLVTQLIAYASYSINFFLYSFSGIAFRTNLRQLINKFRRH